MAARALCALLLSADVVLVTVTLAGAGAVLSAVPSQPDSAQRYLIYSHGQIVAERGPNATTREYGAYDYYGILNALAARGFTVVSEIRPPLPSGSDIALYGDHVTGQIRVLLNAGVPAGNVSVVGFSEGGAIAIAAAAGLANPNVKFVVMAGCWDGPRFRHIVERRAPLMKGRMLSIYDAGDTEARSCADAFAKAGDGFVGEETVLHARGGHGLFYRPRPEWINPVTEWLLR